MTSRILRGDPTYVEMNNLPLPSKTLPYVMQNQYGAEGGLCGNGTRQDRKRGRAISAQKQLLLPLLRGRCSGHFKVFPRREIPDLGIYLCCCSCKIRGSVVIWTQRSNRWEQAISHSAGTLDVLGSAHNRGWKRMEDFFQEFPLHRPADARMEEVFKGDSYPLLYINNLFSFTHLLS